MTDTVSFKVRYRKDDIPITIGISDTVLAIKQKVEEALGINPSLQKLLFKGVLKDDKTVGDSGIKDGISVKLMASKAEDVTAAQARAEEASRHNARVASMKERMAGRKGTGQRSSGGANRGIQTLGDSASTLIGRIEVLPLPNSDQARAILERVASDRGIVAIMKKHNWRVGTLKELDPRIQTHTEKLEGLNENKGQAISLCLRFAEGWKTFESIIDVMLHELCHNDIGPHDASFHALNRQLHKERDELDWTRNGGQSLGTRQPDIHPGWGDDDDDDDGEQYGHRLGGARRNDGRSMREVLAQAAQLRLTAREKEVTSHCGSGGAAAVGVKGVADEPVTTADPVVEDPPRNGEVSEPDPVSQDVEMSEADNAPVVEHVDAVTAKPRADPMDDSAPVNAVPQTTTEESKPEAQSEPQPTPSPMTESTPPQAVSEPTPVPPPTDTTGLGYASIQNAPREQQTCPICAHVFDLKVTSFEVNQHIDKCLSG